MVPQHLRGVSKLFDEYGRRLRMKHRGAKHHLKFDNVDQSLFLYIRLKEDNGWTRVYQDSAESWVRQQRREEAAGLNKRLSSTPAAPFEPTGTSAGPFGALVAPAAKSKPKVSTWSGTASARSMDAE